MKAFYADHFVLPLPEGHRFPMAKYARLRQRVVEDDIINPHDLLVPPAATDEELLRCHDREYVERVKAGLLTHREMLRIGFPWSPQMVERSRRSSGATIAAAHVALSEGCAANLAGGTHHAGRDHGEGYCVFNDAPIAIRALQAEGLIHRAIVIDCDVHQGNGTADICRDDPAIFTLSIHGERNFPFRKVAGDMDIGLPDGTSDAEYLDTLAYALERALFLAQPEFAVYVSGADPFEGDKLGKLSLSKDGLRRRDEMVFNALLERRIPVAVAMGGGYAANVDDIVDIHAQTIRAAAMMAQRWQNIYA